MPHLVSEINLISLSALLQYQFGSSISDLPILSAITSYSSDSSLC